MAEAQEQMAVVDYCDVERIPIIHTPNEGKRSYTTANMLRRMGMRKGIPDLFIPVPKGKFHGFFIEMKWGKNKLTEEQKYWLSKLSELGYATAVAYSADIAINKIKKYMKLTEVEK